ncbi:hypothetical protein SDJN02_11165, partial [Cucurbita argyrosperma subsp. argyrosperma]
MNIFRQLQQDFDLLVLDKFTLASIVGTCACLGALESLCQERNVVTWTSMVVAYSQTSMLDDVFRVLSCMQEKNVHTWTALINSFVFRCLCRSWFDSKRQNDSWTHNQKEQWPSFFKGHIMDQNMSWGAVLGSCRMHENLDLAMRAAETVIDRSPIMLEDI